jgi:hypothetical protein
MKKQSNFKYLIIPVMFSLSNSLTIALENADGDSYLKSSIFVKLLGEQFSGEVADYMNSSPDWQLIMEARIRLLVFTYWVNVMKFKVPRIEMLEKRFGELVNVIKDNKAFQRTFVEPNFIKTAESFPVHAFISGEGERFEIKTAAEFDIENKNFIKFLDFCVSKTDEAVKKK